MSTLLHIDNNLVRFLLNSIFRPIAKKVSFGFAIVLFSVSGSWVASMYSGFLVLGLHDFNGSAIKVGIMTVILGTTATTILHYIHYGLFSQLGFRGASRTPRIVNKYLTNGIDWEPINKLDDRDFAKFAKAFAWLPVNNLKVSLFYACLVALSSAGAVYFYEEILIDSLIVLGAGVFAVLIYGYFAYLISDYAVSLLKPKLKEEARSREVELTFPKFFSFKKAFSILLILVFLSLSIGALYVSNNIHNNKMVFLFISLTTILIAIFVFLHLTALQIYLGEIHIATQKMVKGESGSLFSSFDYKEIRESSKNFNELAIEFFELRRDLEQRIKERTMDIMRAKDQAEAANRAKSDFLANMSHEIRTPMNGIIGMTEILLKTPVSDDQKEYLNIIENSANTLLAIINDILDFSKIEANKLELESVLFSITKVVEEVADNIAIKAAQKNLNLVTFVDTDTPAKVYGDPLRLKQILLNLANNAVKFTDAGEIFISAELSEKQGHQFKMIFKVSDTGIGIPEEQREKLFKSFSQVDTSITRKYGGTGLGLIISRRLVHLMHGTIDVESNDKEGSTFWFSAYFNEDPQIEPEIENQKQILKGLRVLVVDDNATNLQIFRKYLEFWYCEVEEVIDPRYGLKQIREAIDKNDPYDVVLVDCQMPDLDGLSFAKEVTRITADHPTRMVMLSSIADIIPPNELKESGFVGYLNKPVKIQDLRITLEKALKTNLPEAITGDEEYTTELDEDTAPSITVHEEPEEINSVIQTQERAEDLNLKEEFLEMTQAEASDFNEITIDIFEAEDEQMDPQDEKNVDEAESEDNETEVHQNEDFLDFSDQTSQEKVLKDTALPHDNEKEHSDYDQTVEPIIPEDESDEILELFEEEPPEEPAQIAQPVKPTPKAQKPGKTPLILLVEDNKINQRIATLHLEKMGYKIELAENGMEAFEKYQTGDYNLIFMDIMMPVMDGFEATKTIREYEKLNNVEKPIHIIAMTANAMKGDRESCLEVGMNDYISKPFKAEELQSLLKSVFKGME